MGKDDSIEQALAIGEVTWALARAKAAIKSAGAGGGRALYEALRVHAEIQLANADDTDLPDVARAAAAWIQVTRHALAKAADFDTLAWAELLAFKPRKAQAALDACKVKHDATVRAVAWAQRRKDAKRHAALEDIATTCDHAHLEWIVRLLVQADLPAIAHADRLAALREDELDVWDSRVARAVILRVSAHRSVGERERAGTILTAWKRACTAALADATDVRRHVLDTSEGTPGDEIGRAERRVQRATQHFGASSPALEQPLALLAFTARHANQHMVAVDALLKLEVLRAKDKTRGAHALRADLLVDLYKSLTELRRFPEAFAVIERYEQAKARLPLHLVPDHHARARVYEAMGDLDRMVDEHLAAVAQYEAAPPPVYGPTASNTCLARGWARMALERAGRHVEAKQRFPKDSG